MSCLFLFSFATTSPVEHKWIKRNWRPKTRSLSHIESQQWNNIVMQEENKRKRCITHSFIQMHLLFRCCFQKPLLIQEMHSLLEHCRRPRKAIYIFHFHFFILINHLIMREKVTRHTVLLSSSPSVNALQYKQENNARNSFLIVLLRNGVEFQFKTQI